MGKDLMVGPIGKGHGRSLRKFVPLRPMIKKPNSSNNETLLVRSKIRYEKIFIYAV